MPRRAVLLAAGLGTRMRPLTEHTAKPLLPLGGRALLDHALDRLAAAGVDSVVVNAHWHAAQVVAHLAGRPPPPRTLVQHEARLLETGGAVRAALPLLGEAPFFVVNGDAFWLDGPTPALRRLAAVWRDGLDAVLLVQQTALVAGETGPGDFVLDPMGRLRRRGPGEIVPYIYAGVQLVSPALFAAGPEGAFSTNLLWDRAIAADRVRAVVHDGLWFHLSTPADLATAAAQLQDGTLGEAR